MDTLKIPNNQWSMIMMEVWNWVKLKRIRFLLLSDQQRPPPTPEHPANKQVRTILITEAERVGGRGTESDERPSFANRIL